MSKELTKQDITDFMLSEMAEHDLLDIPFWWDKSKTYFGRVHYRYGNPMKVTGISLSESFFNGLVDKWEMIDTVYHEIAHAVAIRDHQSTGHGDVWKGIAAELGARPQRCSNKPINRRAMGYKYTAFCVDCAYEYPFSRMGKKWQRGRYYCPDCGNDLEVHKNY